MISKLRNWHFWAMALLIILLPLAREWRLFAFGDRVEAEVIGELGSPLVVDYAAGKKLEFALIEYRHQGVVHRVPGPRNMEFDKGKRLPLILDPLDPEQYIIATPKGFYTEKVALRVTLVLVIWLALFQTLMQVKNGRVSFRKEDSR